MAHSLLNTAPEKNETPEISENPDGVDTLQDTAAVDTGAAEMPRPDHIPEKFWDTKAGAPRVEDLAKSYAQLEKKLGSMVLLPGENASGEDRAAFMKALGVPPSAEDYQITIGEGPIENDAEVNKALHAAGFSSAQAQVVYDLARDKVMPMIEEAAAEFEAQRQSDRLENHFGSKAKWEETSRQLHAWGKTNLPDNVLGALATTYEGVLTLHEMMKSGEPPFIREGQLPKTGVQEAELKALMRDPAYWRDHDPVVMKKVTDGFEALYGKKE